jgi:hypothetical protein
VILVHRVSILPGKGVPQQPTTSSLQQQPRRSQRDPHNIHIASQLKMSNTRCIDQAKNSYLVPRLMLALSSILYASAYPSITVMNNLLPPSFTTMARMILASIPLLPFLCRLEQNLVRVTILSGCFDAMAHITLSLVSTSDV